MKLENWLTKAKPPAKFEPAPYFGAKEDCLTVYLKDADSYAQRVDDFLTLFLEMGTGELIGCQVKGVLRRLKALPQFNLRIVKDEVRLDLLFLLLSVDAAPNASDRYLELSRSAPKRNVSLPSLV